ncbi:hypothetical protein BT93_B1433 [Corymbia citriodora subsp. variegata]|nr:hypothetical protein BT93_B1433 [Corymbia citriodora subsp. variegata]
MTSRRIDTVQDFLRLYEADVSSLRQILGNGITNRMWETIVRHASTCVVDDNKMYTYNQAWNRASILFNSVMKVAQVTLDGETYQSLHQLTPSQKILMQKLRRQAYYSKNQWVLVDAQPSITSPRALTNLPTEPSIGLSPPLHHLDYTVLNQDIPEVAPEFNYSLASISRCYNVPENRQLDCLGPQSHTITKTLNPTMANILARQEFLSGISAGETSHHPGYSRDPFGPNIHLSPESSIPGNLMWTPEHASFIESSSGADLGICPSGTVFGVCKTTISRPRAAWCKIRAVVKWGSVRRVVAARRTAMYNYPHY